MSLDSLLSNASWLERTHNAILSSFSRDELRQAVQFALGLPLDAITADKALASQVFDLLLWSARTGRSLDLINFLLADRPQNRELAAIAEALSGAQPMDIVASAESAPTQQSAHLAPPPPPQPPNHGAQPHPPAHPPTARATYAGDLPPARATARTPDLHIVQRDRRSHGRRHSHLHSTPSSSPQAAAHATLYRPRRRADAAANRFAGGTNGDIVWARRNR
jgi:type IV secretory pathway VirB10-like protein